MNKVLDLKIEGDILNEERVLEEFSEDKSIFKIKPKAVIFPKSIKDISLTINYAKENNLSLTSRSAGTDMSGGAIGEDLILVFTKYFNHFEINKEEKVAYVEPGVYFKDFEKEISSLGLMMPSYPASKDLCALGGMIANNSGGEKTLKYGKTENYVEELNVVLNDGNEYKFKKISFEDLERKMALENFEGELYRKTYKLLKENIEIIKRSQPKVKKNSAGYNIWNVLSPEGFDLSKIFVGSQGTLGIITKAKLRLVEKEKIERLIVVFMKDLNLIPNFLQKILPLNPTSLEITDDHTFKIYLKFAKEMAEILGVKGIFSTFKLFLPEIKLIAFSGIPKLIILIQFGENDEKLVEEKIIETEKILRDLKLKYRTCKDEKEAQKYWKLRRDTFKLLREKIKNRLAAPFIDDIIVNPEYFPEFFPKLKKILDESKIIYTISGHLGDGNLHIIPLLDMKKEREIIFPLMEKVYDLVLEYQGSFTAEHNDGLIRGYYLRKLFGEEIYKIFVEIKNIFDPYRIFNRSKKIDVDLEYVKSKIKN
jgi:FAD/FMN-containing dehydrogenase